MILCGGAINSPQLLQLSGVGNAAELSALGIKVVADLPGVGENLQDHLEVYVQHACTQPVSAQPALKWSNRPWVGAQWLFARRGPGATNHFEAGGFLRSNDDVAYPNLMFHFLPLAVRYDGISAGGRARLPVPRRPDVLRRARLGEDHVDATRAASPRCASTTCRPTSDRREWVEALRVTRELLAQPAWADFDGGELSPGPAGRDRRADPRLGGARRRDRAAPLVHVRDGPTVVDPDTMRVHGARRPARGRRVGVALRHQRATSTRRR